MLTITPAAYRLAASMLRVFPRSFTDGAGNPRHDMPGSPPWWRFTPAARLVAALENAPCPDQALAELFGSGLFVSHPAGAVAMARVARVALVLPDGTETPMAWPPQDDSLDELVAGAVDALLAEVAA